MLIYLNNNWSIVAKNTEIRDATEDTIIKDWHMSKITESPPKVLTLIPQKLKLVRPTADHSKLAPF